MRIEVIPEHGLSADIDTAIGRLLETAFGSEAGYGGRSFHKRRHNLRLLAWDGDVVIGHVAVALRAIRIGQETLTIAGLAEVATLPDRQGQGVATALLVETLAQARGTLADFAVLFGDHPIYPRHGFTARPNRLRFVGYAGGRPDGIFERAFDCLMVLPLGSRDWDDAAEIDLLGPLF